MDPAHLWFLIDRVHRVRDRRNGSARAQAVPWATTPVTWLDRRANTAWLLLLGDGFGRHQARITLLATKWSTISAGIERG
jgi:hypothetical protein